MLDKINRTKRYWALLLIGLLMAGGLFGLFHNLNLGKEEEKEVDPNKVWLHTDKVSSFKNLEVFGDDNRYVFFSFSEPAFGFAFVGQNHVVNYEKRTKQRGEYDPENKELDKGEFFKIYIYDLETEQPLKSVKTVDLYQLDLGEGYDNYLVDDFSEIGFYEGQDYLVLSLRKQGESPVEVLFNLKTQSLEEMTDGFRASQDQQEEVATDSVQVRSAVHLFDILYDRLNLKIVRYEVSDTINGTSPKLSETNFANLYPELTQQMIEDDGEIYVRQGYRNLEGNERWFNDAIHWFAPKGQERMELYASRYDYSTEPKTELYKTPVSSYADVKAWLEVHPEEE